MTHDVDDLRQWAKLRGFHSMRDWAAGQVDVHPWHLPAAFGENVVPVTLWRAMSEEAYRSNEFSAFVRDMILRVIRGKDELHGDARGLSNFMIYVQPEPRHKPTIKNACEQIAQHLGSHPDWAPDSVEDPVIQNAFGDTELQRNPEEHRAVEIWQRIDSVLKAKMDLSDTEALRPLPSGYIRVWALHWVEAEVCNGGFLQYFQNTRGEGVRYAISALRAMRRFDLAAIVGESARSASAYHKSLLATTVVPDADDGSEPPRTLDELDEAFYAAREQEPLPSVVDFARDKPGLFE